MLLFKRGAREQPSPLSEPLVPREWQNVILASVKKCFDNVCVGNSVIMQQILFSLEDLQINLF